MDDAKLTELLGAIDAVNAEDPSKENGEAAALLYGKRMSGWLSKLNPEAPAPLQIAVRAQHIRRWDIPRDSFPNDRKGYLMWRKQLYKHHAEVTEKILVAQGCAPELVERVKFLVEKRQLNKDPDTQCLEDCACLVFLQHHFADFAPAHDTEKLSGIVQKTWAKMSPQAQGHALSLNFSPEHSALLKQILP